MTNAFNLQARTTPPKLIQMLGERGSRNVRVFHAMNGDRSVSVIASEDPSGDGGAMELHVSISVGAFASDGRVGPAYPTPVEIASAQSVANVSSRTPTNTEFINGILNLWFTIDETGATK
jgi:hypothetical protein